MYQTTGPARSFERLRECDEHHHRSRGGEGQFGARYQHECRTQLVWLAARYSRVRLGAVVMANSFRSPALVAKMAATAQVLSEGGLILGYGAGPVVA